MPVSIDKRGFRIDNEPFFPIGVNYWPRDSAVYLWKRFDKEKIEKEFRVMNELGINCIRFFIMWDDLSEEIGKINQNFLNKFDIFHEIAKSHNVKLNPTLFIGHMSGQDWFPKWFLLNDKTDEELRSINHQTIFLPPRKKKQGKIRDIYTDPTIFEEAFRQLTFLFPKYKDSNTIIAWDISNENQYWMRPKSPENGYRYLEKMVSKMKELDPNHPITLGMGKLSEPSGFHSFGEWGINKPQDYYSVHTYPVFYYPMTPQFIDFYITYKIGFDVRMAYCLTKQPVQEQEFGLSDGFFRYRRKKNQERLLGGYYWTGLWSAFNNGAYAGILTWCFTDFLDALQKKEPYNHKLYEMWFGVVNKKYEPKISGKKLKAFSQLMEKIKPHEWLQKPAEVAILLPENYLKALIPKEAGNNKAITDDNPIKEILGGARFKNPESLSNINRSIFCSYVNCQMNHIIPDFLTFDELHNTTYKLIIAPNHHQLSDENKQRIIEFCEKGGIFYTSGTLISKFQDFFKFNDSKSKQIESDIKKKRIVAKASENSFEKEGEISLDFIELINDVMKHFNVPEENILFRDIKSEKPWLVHSKIGNGYLLCATSSPELCQTTKRNMYKKDQMPTFYKWLVQISEIKNYFSCHNPFIEIGSFTHSNNPETDLLVLINHSQDQQNITIKIEKPFEILNKFTEKSQINTQTNEILLFLEGYTCSVLTIRFL